VAAFNHWSYIMLSIQDTKPVIAITGASSGIGAAAAQVLAARGARVVLGARRLQRLETLASELRTAGGIANAQMLDVTQRTSVEHFIEQTVALHERIDVLINNAGVMPLSRMDVLEVGQWERTIDVNVKGVLYGIAAALPRMRAQGSGHIINIASIGAHRSYPGAAVYCASKFAVWAISDSLRQELVDDGVRVTTISPGTTESELADHITDAAAADAMRVFRANVIAPQAIAQAIAYAIAQSADVTVSEIVVRPTRSAD
jgi:NADP-dependent 3-hydroxy acid dehydrogenase YdfG